jgi:glycine cleavage system transcriptional repressor
VSQLPQRQYVVSVMSRDRVGIVAEVSGAISALQGDIADMRQSVLRGHFTMILLARFPGTVTPADIQGRIAAASACGPVPLHVAVLQADNAPAVEPITPAQDTYLLTARGPDRIGFVASVSSFCARNGLNILDLSTTVVGNDYVMMLLVDVSHCDDLDALRRRLHEFGNEAGLSAVLQHEAIFRATNEVDP